jgi:hypothetical protein
MIIILAAVKTQFKDMYLPVSLHAWIGLMEVGALCLWLYFVIVGYKFGSDIYALLAVILVGLYFLTNIINLLCYCFIRKDRKYSVWLLDHKFGNVVIMCISTIVSFRFSRIEFSKLGGW